MTADRSAAAPSHADELTHRQILTILSGLMMGMFLAALDQTIVATVDPHHRRRPARASHAGLGHHGLPDHLDDLDAALRQAVRHLRPQAVLPVRDRDLRASARCCAAFADSMYQLAAFRAVQGIGAGGLFSLALAIIGDIVPPRERAKYQGYFLAVFGTSSVLGPVVGGFFAGADTILGITGWRWVFWSTCRSASPRSSSSARVLHLPHTRRDHRIDWPGARRADRRPRAAADRGRAGPRRGAGARPVAVACYAIGAGRPGRRSSWPSGRTATTRCCRCGCSAAGRSAIGVDPQHDHRHGHVRRRSPRCRSTCRSSRAPRRPRPACMLLPLVAGIMAGSIISGQLIARTGRYKIFPVIGVGAARASACCCSARSAWTPRCWPIDARSWRCSASGLGGNMQPLVLAVQNAVPPRDMGVATSSATFFRQMGGTLGTAVFLSMLFSTVGDKIAAAFKRRRYDAPRSRPRCSDPAGARRPDQRRCRQGDQERWRLCRPARWTTRRSCHTSTRGWPDRSWSASPTRSTWCSSAAPACCSWRWSWCCSCRRSRCAACRASRPAAGGGRPAAARPRPPRCEHRLEPDGRRRDDQPRGRRRGHRAAAAPLTRVGYSRGSVGLLAAQERVDAQAVDADRTASAAASSTIATAPSSHQWLAVPTTTMIVMIGCAPARASANGCASPR